MSNNKTQRPMVIVTIVTVLVLALTAGSFFIQRAWAARKQSQKAEQLAALQQKEADAIADKLGIRITQVAVTADGGLIDLRYQVIDPDKAIFLFQDLTVVPKMIAKDGTTIELASVPHRHDVTAGLTYFILYRNVENSIQPGSNVTISVGDDLHLDEFAVAK
jgi:hypothetical protein